MTENGDSAGTGIVERLRTHDWINWAEGMEEAADEIERLRDEAADLIDSLMRRALAAEAERDRLRELLREARDAFDCIATAHGHIATLDCNQSNARWDIAKRIDAALSKEAV